MPCDRSAKRCSGARAMASCWTTRVAGATPTNRLTRPPDLDRRTRWSRLSSNIHRIFDIAGLVGEGGQGGARMAHPQGGPGIPHDLPRQLTRLRLVAVDRALGTSRLGRAIGALLEPTLGVFEKPLAVRATPAVQAVAVTLPGT